MFTKMRDILREVREWLQLQLQAFVTAAATNNGKCHFKHLG